MPLSSIGLEKVSSETKVSSSILSSKLISSLISSESDEVVEFSIVKSAKSVMFESSSVLNVESSPLVKSSFCESPVVNCESSLNISEKSVESKSGKSSSSVLFEKF